MDKIEVLLSNIVKTNQELTQIEFENLGVSHKKYYIYELAKRGASNEFISYLYEWPHIERLYKAERRKVFKGNLLKGWRFKENGFAQLAKVDRFIYIEEYYIKYNGKKPDFVNSRNFKNEWHKWYNLAKRIKGNKYLLTEEQKLKNIEVKKRYMNTIRAKILQSTYMRKQRGKEDCILWMSQRLEDHFK